MKKTLLLSITFLSVFICLIYLPQQHVLGAEPEKLTVSTYFPSPYGVHKVLRLFPNNDFTPEGACTNAGELAYHQNENKLYLCDGSVWVAFDAAAQQPTPTVPQNCRLVESDRKLSFQEVINQRCTGFCFWYAIDDPDRVQRKYIVGTLTGPSVTDPSQKSISCWTYYRGGASSNNLTVGEKTNYIRCD